MDALKQWQQVRATDSPGSLTLGPNTFDRYINDPKRLAFMLARYKFAAKMLRDCDSIIDVGCGDGFGTVTFLTDTKATSVMGYDFDETLIDYAINQLKPAIRSARGVDADRIGFFHGDFHEGQNYGVDGIACLDVIEHVEPDKGHDFIRKIHSSLNDNGVAVIGTPSELASAYASPHSQLGHINLYTPHRLRSELKRCFRHVFMLGMNDEMLHVGYDKMWHYIAALVCK